MNSPDVVRERCEQYNIMAVKMALKCRNKISRPLLYRLVSSSGLRRNETILLKPCDYTLGEKPLWHLRPEISKGKRADTLPMSAEAAAVLTEVRDKGTKLIVPDARILDSEMEAAGIVKVDGSGRMLSFHSFRYFFCTRLAAVMRIQHVSRLMRHASISITADLYADLGLDDLGGAINDLPPLL